MTSYRNSFPKRKGNYPKKSDRELESFLPDNMKSQYLFSERGTKTQDRRKQSTLTPAPDEFENRYSYSDSAKKFINRQNKENKYNEGNTYKDSHISRKQWDQSARRDYHGRQVASKSPKPVFMNPKKIMKPFEKISSETFQTAAMDTLPAMPQQFGVSRSSTVTVLSRNVKKVEEKKEPVKKIQILKPTSNVGTTTSTATASRAAAPTPVPIILSRSKPLLEGPFKILAPAFRRNHVEPIRSENDTWGIRAPNFPFSHRRFNPKINPAKQMRQPFRIIDADFKLCEGYTAFNAFLVDQPSFLVIGVVGRQGVGKSTVASLLAQTTLDGKAFERGFRVSGRQELLKGSHCTGGIDAFITPQRIIVLDFPAILAPGVLDGTANSSDLGRRALELQVQMRSLELLALAVRVCHFIVVVQDSKEQGTHTLKCLQAAAVLSQQDIALSTPVVRESEDPATTAPVPAPVCLTVPTVMIVCNKTPAAALSAPLALRAFEVNARRQLRPGLLNISCSVGEAPRRTLNLFTLPLVPRRAKDRSKLSTSALQLRAAIMGLERRIFPGFDTPPTERNWFEYVIREWEKILKSSLYLDYSRLFP